MIASDECIRNLFRRSRAAAGRLRAADDAVEPVQALQRVRHARSGFVAGDKAHVRENRALYAQKFGAITPMLAEVLDVAPPDAAFYLWVNVASTGLSNTEFARRFYDDYNAAVLPGSYLVLARDAHGTNPSRDSVRIALVAESAECLDGTRRIVDFCRSLTR
ncbi:MAG: hypothetical protein VB142_03255 [Burkholderia sp.]